MLRPLPRAHTPLGPEGAEVLRLITQRRFPVRLIVHANGRRRYGYWLPLDSSTGRGGCYVALPTGECDALHAAGRIVLGEPLVDPGKTMYPVEATARTAATGPRAAAGPSGSTGTGPRTPTGSSPSTVPSASTGSSAYRHALTA
jgi:hypothetical protein